MSDGSIDPEGIWDQRERMGLNGGSMRTERENGTKWSEGAGVEWDQGGNERT